MSHVESYLVYFGLNQEQFDQCGGALNGSVDVLQSQTLLTNLVIVLGQEVLDPQ